MAVIKLNESFYIGWTKFNSLNDFKDTWFKDNNYNYKAWVIYKNDEGDWRLTTTYDYKHPEYATYWQVDPKIITEIKEDPDLSEIIVDDDFTENTKRRMNESKLSNTKLIMNLLRGQGFECVLNREGKVYVYASKDQIENTFDAEELSDEIWDKLEITPYNVYTEITLTEGTSLKRIARMGEFDNGHVIFNYDEMSDEEANDKAKKKSIEDPDNVYYVIYDDIMYSPDIYWYRGRSYNNRDVRDLYYGGRKLKEDTVKDSHSQEQEMLKIAKSISKKATLDYYKEGLDYDEADEGFFLCDIDEDTFLSRIKKLGFKRTTSPTEDSYEKGEYEVEYYDDSMYAEEGENRGFIVRDCSKFDDSIKEDTVRKISESKKSKYKYFAVTEDSSGKYFTKRDALRDLKSFGDDEVRLYTLKDVDNVQDLTSEDLLGIYKNGKLVEDTVKKSNGKWTNRGDDGTEHGEFKSKKQADAQRKAMYANGYKGESVFNQPSRDDDYYDAESRLNRYLKGHPGATRRDVEDIFDDDKSFLSKLDYYGLLDDLEESLKEDLKVGDTRNVYCDDCESWTRQTYKGETLNGEDMFTCQECGCENYQDIEEESLKESYSDGKISLEDLEGIRGQVDDLIDAMNDFGVTEIQSEPNTYKIGHPFVGTYSGFIDLSDPYKYIPEEDDEDDYEYESLSESISVGDRVYHVDDDPQTRVSGVVEEIYEDGDALVSFMDRDSGEVDYATVPIDKLENIDYEYESFKEGITEIRSKKVEDDDGFETDYTMYKDSDGSYFFMFGDKDFYPPERSYSDYECDTEDEANEWFDSYSSTGCYEDEYEDGYEYESLTESEDDTDEDPLDLAQMSFESGHYFDRRDFGTDDDYEEYMSYIQLGPEGFYDEFKDELDFSQSFVDEYGDIGDFGYED